MLLTAILQQKIVKGNNLRHEHGGMHIAVTVPVVKIYAKITKSA